MCFAMSCYHSDVMSILDFVFVLLIMHNFTCGVVICNLVLYLFFQFIRQNTGYLSGTVVTEKLSICSLLS